MSSRTRTERGSVAGSEEIQVWQAVRAQLRGLDSARSASLAGYERLLRASPDAKNLDSLYSATDACVQNEQKYITGALEQLDILLALRKASSANMFDMRRKKRKADETDLAVSLTDVASKDTDGRKTRNSGMPRSSMAGQSEHAARLRSQLPLQNGRKVAFCQPNDGGEEEWILATVLECVNEERSQYKVQDAEDDGASGPTWTTTIDSMAPLPNSIDTLPGTDYPVGARVLALYPDTSCFYWATVQGGGPKLNGKSRSKLIKRENELLHAPYSVMFYDDGADIKQVPAYLVVEHP